MLSALLFFIRMFLNVQQVLTHKASKVKALKDLQEPTTKKIPQLLSYYL